MKIKKVLVWVFLLVILIVIGFYLNKNMNVNDEMVQELYFYLGVNNLNSCGGLINYSKDKVSVSDISDDVKICLAYANIDEDNKDTVKLDKTKKENTCKLSDDKIFATDNYEDDVCSLESANLDKVNEQYKKMYNEEIKDYQKFTLDNTKICYSSDNKYYCGLSESYTYVVGATPHTYRTIKKVVKNKDSIVIYDYFIKVINDKCYISYVEDLENEKCTKEFDSKKVDYKFLKKYGQLYKHTFKKQGKAYYFESSEIVK